MKKLILGAILLGFANLSYSQSSECGTNVIKLSGVEVSAVNQNYLKEVEGSSISDVVYILESKAARYNIEQSPSYDDNDIGIEGLSKTYGVKFSQPKGEIYATYDRNGNIISTNEKYFNLAPPPAVRNSAFKALPDWKVNSTSYTVNYNGKDAKKAYKIQLSKDRQKKTLKFDVDGKSVD